MIKKLAFNILNYIIRNNAISDEINEKEYYQYGIEITISSLLNIILILSIGFITKNMIESIIFLPIFILLRHLTGGYHANSYFMCNLSFCIAFSLLITMYNLTWSFLTSYSCILISFVSIGIIAIYCPIEHINKPIKKEHRKYYKTMAMLLGTVYGIIGTVLTVFSNKYGALVLYTLFLVAVLVIIAISKERWDKNEQGK